MTGGSELGLIHRWVPARVPQLPTLLLLHGTGGNEDDLLPLGDAILPGAAQLSPRGAVLEHGMPRFFRRIAEGVFDLDDLRRRTADLSAFVRAAAARYGFDDRNVLAIGFSNGANIAASLLLAPREDAPVVPASAILLRPMVPFEPQGIDLSGHRVLVSASRTDPIIPAAQPTRLADVLRQAGADTTLAWLPGGHGLSQADVVEARAWLAKGSGA